MSDEQRRLDAARVRIEVVSPRSSAARRCLKAYFDELQQRFEGGFDPVADRGASATPEELTPPAGYFALALLDGEPIGCGALKLADGVGEIKRMWVASSARGLGLGRRLLATLEELARDAGARRVQLDSHRALGEALALYRSAGYEQIPAFNDNPYAHYWFGKTLTGR